MNITNLAHKSKDFTGNVWLISGEQNILIDTGKGDVWKEIDELESIEKVIITHSHYDHVDNLPKVLDRFHPRIYAYTPENLPVDSEKLEEGDSIELLGSKFEIFHTPGHKDDSICLYSSKDKILFTGDLIFPKGSFGRTDLDEGDRDVLIKSIEKIVDLDVEKMYCGHDDAATENVGQQIKKSLKQAKKKEPKY